MMTRLLVMSEILFAVILNSVTVVWSAPPAERTVLELNRVRLKAARDTYREMGKLEDEAKQRFEPERYYVWSKRILEVEREMARNKEAVSAAFQAHFERMEAIQEKAKVFAKGGQIEADRVSAAEYFRAEAEIWRARDKAKK